LWEPEGLKLSEKIAPLAAVLGVFSSIACCLPFGIAAAAGAAGLGVALEPLRPWLIGLSVILLAFGLWQLYRSKGACLRRSRLSVAIFWVSALMVLAFILFPQAVASFLADRLPDFSASAGLQVVELASLDVLKDDFNRAAGQTRVIVLLSPT
jgi:mercuric ion transport protein